MLSSRECGIFREATVTELEKVGAQGRLAVQQHLHGTADDDTTWLQSKGGRALCAATLGCYC